MSHYHNAAIEEGKTTAEKCTYLRAILFANLRERRLNAMAGHFTTDTLMSIIRWMPVGKQMDLRLTYHAINTACERLVG